MYELLGLEPVVAQDLVVNGIEDALLKLLGCERVEPDER